MKCGCGQIFKAEEKRRAMPLMSFAATVVDDSSSKKHVFTEMVATT